jgi:phage repressor protein C with HTH and peptisase S24 domain
LKNISDIVDRIKGLKNYKSDSDVARALRMTDTALYNHKSRGSIPFKNISTFCEVSGVSFDWLLMGEGPKYREEKEKKEGPVYNKVKEKGYTLVPQYDVQVSTGGGACVHSEQIVDHLAFKTAWIKKDMNLDPEKLSLITVIGDSMEPTVREGDLLLIDLRQTQVTDDAIYVLSLDGRLLAKRLQLAVDGTIYIRSDNPVYKELTVSKDNTEDLHVIGRVIWIGRRV